jgi:hypothetical protein
MENRRMLKVKGRTSDYVHETGRGWLVARWVVRASGRYLETTPRSPTEPKMVGRAPADLARNKDAPIYPTREDAAAAASALYNVELSLPD